ncbi:shikimate dehydrogenase [Nocardioides sp. Bht2]|uniref:shikimate dehydrogenase n=1 Tax=Nocardioides sp. Bht2 TaxID=3392297 RepID=UPI0039B4F276
MLGDPIDHSLSPILHRAGYAAAGLEWSYTAHRVNEEELAGFLGALDDSWRGFSLTMPLKRALLPLVDEVSETARLAGGANTLLLRSDGTRLADNTDVPGAVAALRERFDGTLESATILGGGATATSLGMAFTALGARTLRLLVRSPERAVETRTALAALPEGPAIEVGILGSDQVVGDAVASTIPASAQSQELVASCAGAKVLFEAIYDPWPTPLAAAATALGQPLVSGLDLLIHQAALQFTLFTGEPAPLATMRAAGEWALAQRG